MNIIEYVNHPHDKPVDFNHEVDALILAMASYFEFEDIFEVNQFPVKLKDLNVMTKLEEKHSKLRQQHNDLISSMMKSTRFGELEIIHYENELDLQAEHQFFAITYQLNQQLFIAFRGTDFSPVGWKEDFNMSFAQYIPAQNSALNYLNKHSDQFDCPIYLGGHSKGGNLAVYAAAHSKHKDRIMRIFNFDGPGYNQNFVESLQYENILDRIVKYTPHAAIVGRLLDSKEEEIIVDSKNISFFQHNAYEWKIEDDHFVYLQDYSPASNHLIESIRLWIEEVSEEQRKYIVNEIYDGFLKLDINSLEDVGQYLSLDTLKTVIDVHKNADPEFKETIRSLLSEFIKEFVNFKKGI